MGLMLTPRGYSGMSETFLVVTTGVSVCVCTNMHAICIWWVEGRDAAKSPTMQKIASIVKNNLAQNVNSTETGKHLTCFSSKNLPLADA